MTEILGTKSRAPTWKIDSPEYSGFCGLCKRKKWTSLPQADDELK